MDLDLDGIHDLDVAMCAVDCKECTVVAGIVDICLCVVKTTANVVFVLEVFAVAGLVMATDVGFVLDVVGIVAVIVLAVVVVVVGTNVMTVVLFAVGTTVDVDGIVLFGVRFVVIIFFVVVITEIRDNTCFSINLSKRINAQCKLI